MKITTRGYLDDLTRRHAGATAFLDYLRKRERAAYSPEAKAALRERIREVEIEVGIHEGRMREASTLSYEPGA